MVCKLVVIYIHKRKVLPPTQPTQKEDQRVEIQKLNGWRNEKHYCKFKGQKDSDEPIEMPKGLLQYECVQE